MKKCFIIGGAGFIGRHIINELLNSDREISVIGRNENPVNPIPENVKYYSGNYGNPKFISKLLNNADEVINLAYSSIPKTSYDDPLKDVLENLIESVNFLDTLCDLNIKKIITFSSGGTIYGNTEILPIPETAATNPISPYGITKLTIEKYGFMFNHLKKLPIIVLRPGNAYGEGQKPFSGQGFIATAMASVLEKKEIIVFGQEGTIRDYIHVKDLARATRLAIEKGKDGECYNIGSGQGLSNIDIVKLIKKAAEKDSYEVRIKHLEPREFDVKANILNCEKIFTDTGFKPEINIEDGINLTWRAMLEKYKNSKI